MASAAADTIAGYTSEAYRILPGRADSGLMLVCDHARNAFPPGYHSLGLPEEQLKRHIAYDIGAEAITEMLSASLGVPAVLTHYSRLLIDPNRGADDPTLIMRLSDGAVIPGNRHLADAERHKRTSQVYQPYHDAIDRVIDQCLATGTAPALLSIHSFTESWKGVPRPWHVGVLWDKDPRLARPLLDGFYRAGDLIVGDNEPYKGALHGDTMWQHGVQRGLAHAIIEYRQDLVRTHEGQRAWANRTHAIMVETMSCPNLGPPLHRIEMHGSQSDGPTRARRLLSLHRKPEIRP
jgi:predicted N-formylglutamate amidohydrolase